MRYVIPSVHTHTLEFAIDSISQPLTGTRKHTHAAAATTTTTLSFQSFQRSRSRKSSSNCGSDSGEHLSVSLVIISFSIYTNNLKIFHLSTIALNKYNKRTKSFHTNAHNCVGYLTPSTSITHNLLGSLTE